MSSSGANGNDIAARVARLVALQDAAQSAPASGVTLLLNATEGMPAARIRLGLRGNAVDTTIDVTDPLEAAQLISRSDELRQVLERKGLDPATLNIRATGEEAASAWLPQASRLNAARDSSEPAAQNPGGTPRRDAGVGEQRSGRRNAKEDRR
jgi:hypothetical protein